MLERIPIPGFSEPVNSLSHLLSAGFFLFFGLWMLGKGRGNRGRMFSLSLYVFCNVFLFSMSGVYHLLEKGTDASYVLRVLDHAGIYLMISGSFTPFQIILLRGAKRWVPLAAIWVLATTGISLTAVFFDTMPEWMLLAFFISMGWMSLATVWFIRKTAPETVKLIFIGGVFYTLGAMFDFLRWPALIPSVFEAHELFHLFVTAGAFAHFAAIFRISDFPVSNSLTAVVKRLPGRYKGYFTSERAVFHASSDEEMKEKILDWTRSRFLEPLLPKTIKIKYFQEDNLSPAEKLGENLVEKTKD